MAKQHNVIGMEINPKFIGALFTEQVDDLIRVFCFYLNGEVAQFEMSARDNLDTLRHLFTRLNMEETCSSVVVDEVVQGRFYIRSEENHWLYTLLASPGNILPLFNVDVCSLPWRVCWRSLEAEILEHGQPGEAGHCFAIRTAIGENDASRLVKQSQAFVNPIPVRRKHTHKRLFLNLGVGLACLGIPIVLTLFYTLKPSAKAAAEPVAVVAKAAPQPVPQGSYYLLNHHQITGPYSVKALSDMKADGRINGEVLCRPKNATEWQPFSAVFPSLAAK